MKTKKEWIEELTQKSHVRVNHRGEINGKKMSVSSFYKYASDELRQDKDLNILNFEKNHNYYEIPEGMLDFDFVKRVFEVNESNSFFKLPYQWKNNEREKQFFHFALTVLNYRQKDYKNAQILWDFEPGFWSDLSYTKKIMKGEYYCLELAVVKELNQSKLSEEIDYLKQFINKVPYYLKYIKNKHKSSLPLDTVLSYARDYGINALTKEQKNTYDIVKEAFHHHKIDYKSIDNKWKDTQTLKDLLNCPDIWTRTDAMHVNQLSPELFLDKELVATCLIKGENLLDIKELELNTINTHWFKDKDLKMLALNTYANYKIIEDCLDDKDMVLYFLSNINKSGNYVYSSIQLSKQLSHLDENTLKDKDVMLQLLSIQALKHESIFPSNLINALKSYPTDCLIEFIGLNTEVYKVLDESFKNNWEIILPYYEATKNDSDGFSHHITQKITSLGKSYEQKLKMIKSLALEENLSKNLEEKPLNHKPFKI